MKTADSIRKMRLISLRESTLAKDPDQTRTAKRFHAARGDLLTHVREVKRGGDLSAIVATERFLVENDLLHYANSQAMVSSLKTALNEIAAIERHIGIVDAPEQYRAVDRAHNLPKNRKSGLPFDEARQARASHYTQLDNMDRACLDDVEKQIIDARKAAIGIRWKTLCRATGKNTGRGFGKRQKSGIDIDCPRTT